MRHCDKCNVDIADKIDHCPLCGRNIVGGDEQTVQQFECFPDNKIWQSKRSTILNAIFLILLIGTIVATAVDLIVNKKITKSSKKYKESSQIEMTLKIYLKEG